MVQLDTLHLLLAFLASLKIQNPDILLVLILGLVHCFLALLALYAITSHKTAMTCLSLVCLLVPNLLLTGISWYISAALWVFLAMVACFYPILSGKTERTGFELTDFGAYKQDEPKPSVSIDKRIVTKTVVEVYRTIVAHGLRTVDIEVVCKDSTGRFITPKTITPTASYVEVIFREPFTGSISLVEL